MPATLPNKNPLHRVLFYESEQELVDWVVRDLGHALASGESVAVIATLPHRQAIESALVREGLDEFILHSPRWLVLDAEETLSLFMRDGVPDAKLFDGSVGRVLRSLAETAPVRAFGEMVSLLWQQGNVTAAIELEQLWNDLQQTLGFDLSCAYASEFNEEADADEIHAIREMHSRVHGGKPDRDSSETSVWLDPATDAARFSRLFVTRALRNWQLDDLVEQAAIVVNELVTNAVVHARTAIELRVKKQPESVRLEVFDAVPATSLEARQGLQVVAGFTRDWGVADDRNGKVVWADLAAGEVA
jgi:hypothetical protein